MNKCMKKAVMLFVLFYCCLLFPFSAVIVRADDYDTITKQLEDTKKELENLQKANTTNKTNLKEINDNLTSIKNQVGYLEREIGRKEREVARGEKTLVEQKNLLDQRNISYYKNLGKNSNSLLNLLGGENLGDALRDFFYQKKYLDEDKKNIVSMVVYIGELEDKKADLEIQHERLEPIKKELADQSTFLEKEVSKADSTESKLKSKIAELSEKQQSILSARSGSSVTSVGSVPRGGDTASTIAYKSSAPGNSFALFSFGAYTHRNGMSQYGAKARANAGQSFQDILKHYYPNGTLETKDLPGNIEVQGVGSISFEDNYLLGIAEMPASWPLEALKVQAVAARTYAYARIGSPICTTEACQVYLPSKAANSPDAWKQAVQATRGMVLTSGGSPISTQYASTSGGYINTSGWDTTDNNGGGDWTSRAYESIAGSPWFYRAWYRQGYRDDANSCGRAHPWLSQEEFSDIVNAWIVRKNPSGADTNRILPVTINDCAVGGASGSPYSMAELRELAGKSGGAVTNVTSVSVSNNNNGTTTNVHLETNRGSLDIPGSEFKETFNIRAPGYIAIPQFGFTFFNIEKT